MSSNNHFENGFGGAQRNSGGAANERNASVSRKSAEAHQRSMFTDTETMGQRQYAQNRDAAAFRAQNGASLARGSNNRDGSGSRQFRSDFGQGYNDGGSRAMPGETTMQRGSMTTLAGGIPAFRQGNAQQQQQQYRGQQVGGNNGNNRRMLSMGQMSDFIRQQPGGKQFIDNSSFGGYGYGSNGNGNGSGNNRVRDYNQTLTRSGAEMAAKGQMPPEIMQMGIPMKQTAASSKARANLQAVEQKWAGSSGGSGNGGNKKGWYGSDRAQFINQMQSNEQSEINARMAQAKEQAELDSIVNNMGIPMRQQQRTPQPQPQQQSRQMQQQQQYQMQQKQQAQQQMRQVQQQQVQQQQRPEESGTIRPAIVRVRRPPPAVRLVQEDDDENVQPDEQSSPQQKQQQKQQQPEQQTAQVGTEEFINQLQRDEQQSVSGDDQSMQTSATNKKTFWDAPIEQRQSTTNEAPSALFSENISEIQTSVQQAGDSGYYQVVPDNNIGGGGGSSNNALQTLSVSKTKRQVQSPAILYQSAADAVAATSPIIANTQQMQQHQQQQRRQSPTKMPETVATM